MRTVDRVKDSRNRATSQSDPKLSALFRSFGNVTGHCLCWIDRASGEEVLDFFYHRGKYVDAPRPDLILLDLNLPKKSGTDVQAEIKQDASLLHIPVVILTTSEPEKDVLTSYSLHADCFITKPVDMEQFTEVIKSIKDFWFTIVKLPVSEEK